MAEVSKSGYYYWQKNKGNKIKKDEKSKEMIETIFKSKKEKAGIRTIKMILQKDFKIEMNLKKIARIKTEYDLNTKIRRKNKYNIFTKKQLEILTSPNILNGKFAVKRADEVYSTDISYIFYGKNKNKKAYLSATKDLATKEIVCHEVCQTLSLETGYSAIFDMLSNFNEEKRKNLMIHSDQGFHYTNRIYVNKLKEFGVTQSMSRKGNCLDNAVIESFFGHAKDEIEPGSCEEFEEVKEIIDNYVHFYNNKRYQWGLSRMSPSEYRQYLLKT